MAVLPMSNPGLAALKGPAGWRGEAASGWEAFAFDRLPWTTHTKLGPDGSPPDGPRINCVKASRSRRVYEIAPQHAISLGATEAVRVFAKRYLMNNPRRRISARLLGSKAEREFRLGQRMRAAGLPTPQPLAWAVSFGGGGLPAASYLLTEGWGSGESLLDAIEANPEDREKWLELGARFLASVHDAGFQHNDCSAEHILLKNNIPADSADWTHPSDFPFGLIDIDNGILHSKPVPAQGRSYGLYQILRSIPRDWVSSEKRRDFLNVYLTASGTKNRWSHSELIDAVERQGMKHAKRPVIAID